ncbi:hypothetical protein HGRIS_003278 [Hohenbuehelia grisea]|uniref:Uncharacterized protein n=1 Tax=Hohenbuehelia grisea TaxID=104357 RepID=A0ABR3JNQ2_9AGAR
MDYGSPDFRARLRSDTVSAIFLRLQTTPFLPMHLPRATPSPLAQRCCGLERLNPRWTRLLDRCPSSPLELLSLLVAGSRPTVS